MFRSLSARLRTLTDTVRRRRPLVEEGYSVILTLEGEPLITEDGVYLVLERPVGV